MKMQIHDKCETDILYSQYPTENVFSEKNNTMFVTKERKCYMRNILI